MFLDLVILKQDYKHQKNKYDQLAEFAAAKQL